MLSDDKLGGGPDLEGRKGEPEVLHAAVLSGIKGEGKEKRREAVSNDKKGGKGRNSPYGISKKVRRKKAWGKKKDWGTF